MNTDESNSSGSCKLKLAAVAVLCLLSLYVLSVGPVAKMEDRGMIGERTIRVLDVIYVPLAWGAKNTGAGPFFNWYIFHVWNCDTMGDNTL